MAGASMNDIKARMKSVRSTMQITKAMELVATSKLRRAKERAERSRPYRALLSRAIESVIRADCCTDSPFVRPLGKETLVIAIAGDRGLAGGYNANVYRAVKEIIAAEDGGVTVAPIGKKAKEYYAHRDIKTLDLGLGAVAEIGVGDCIRAAQTVTELVLGGGFGKVVLVYTEFKSMITQTVRADGLLPLGIPEGGAVGAPLLDEEPEEFLGRTVPSFIAGELYSAVSEALASESGARRTAMNAANKNAGEMIDTLMLKFNRARQAVITQEITEIVSGAEAL